MKTCDICEIKSEEVIAGRWIFYCPKHKKEDWKIARENELPHMDDEDMKYVLQDSELQEMMLENF